MIKDKYPVASPNVKVQDVIDWACEGLMFFDDKQRSANEKEATISMQSIMILLSVIAVCQDKEPLEFVKDHIIKAN